MFQTGFIVGNPLNEIRVQSPSELDLLKLMGTAREFFESIPVTDMYLTTCCHVRTSSCNVSTAQESCGNSANSTFMSVARY